jgi:hypothetical protein
MVSRIVANRWFVWSAASGGISMAAMIRVSIVDGRAAEHLRDPADGRRFTLAAVFVRLDCLGWRVSAGLRPPWRSGG